MLNQSRAVAVAATWVAVLMSAPVALRAADTADANSSADANANDSDGRGRLEDIVVTARRRAENVQDVPIPITALSGKSLEEAGQYRLEDLNERLPSLNAQFANPRQTSIAVRGLGNNPANDGLESSVGVYLDDVYLGRPGMANQDFVDIDQVSLLRGPQGTLFGKNTTAGVLNITTRAPSFTPDGTVEVSGGNYGYYQVRGTLSGPLADDTVAGRLSYAKTSRDGFIADVTDGRRLNGVDRQGLRGQLLFKPNDALSVRVIGDYEKEDSNCCVSVLYNEGPNNGALLKARLAAASATEIFDPNFLSSSMNDFQHMEVRQSGGSVQANWRFDGGYNLTSITAFRSWHFVPTNDADSTSVSAIINAGQADNDSQASQEFRVASPTGGPIDWVGGIYYFYQYQNNQAYTLYGPAAHALYGLPAFYNDAYSLVHAHPKTNSYAAFGQGTWHATEKLGLTLGLRDTTEEKTSHIERDAPVGAPGIALALQPYSSGDLKVSNNNVSALASLGYKFDANVLGYLSAAHGAKAGGINQSVPGAGLTVASLYVSPEKANDYELGFKSILFNQRLLVNVNLFWTDVTDYQATQLEQTTPGVFVQTLSNIGRVRTRGVETEVTAKPLDWFALDLNASYNDAVYTSYANAPCSVESSIAGKTSCDLTGQQVVGAPKWVVNPDVSVNHDLGGGVNGYALAGYSWRSSFFGTSDNSEYGLVKAYGLVNLRLGVRSDLGRNKWDFSLWANNALDKRYLVGGLSGATFRAYSLFPGTPRFWGATIRVEF
jgi:iron complex outermembrane receptor protein